MVLCLALGSFSLNSTAGTTVVITTQNNNSFTPSSVGILVGDSVSFTNAGGDHNVTGYNPAPPPEPFCGTTILGPGPMCKVTFTNAGVFRFRCVPHSNGAGTNFNGMVGLITVTNPPIPAVVPGQSFVVSGDSVTLSLTNLLNVPSSFQWQFNGDNIAHATNATLALSSLTPSQSGSYSVAVSNEYQVVTATPGTLQVADSVIITQQPASTNAPAGSNAIFRVSALSPLPIAYQWQFNGTDLPSQTNATLGLTNLQFYTHIGEYRVLVSDSATNIWSDTATLVVLTRPVITNPPVAQTVLQGGTAVFTVVAGPNHPLNPLAYRWIRGGVAYLTSSVPVLVFTNVQASTSVRVGVTNLSTGGAGVSSAAVNLTMLPDFDSDGVADAWESLYGFNTNNAGDATLDPDGDGLSNRDEYNAGTNPTDAASVLTVQMTSLAPGTTALTFLAISNRSYSVEGNTNLIGGAWDRIQDVLAQPADRLESVADTNAAGPMRFYRVVTPKRP